MALETVPASPENGDSITLAIADELLDLPDAATPRQIQVAARLAWREFGLVHFAEVTLVSIALLLEQDQAAAKVFLSESIRELERMSAA